MPQMLPQSNELDIRDYLYIDRSRVGSLLAQLYDGLPESNTSSNTRSNRLSLGLKQLMSLGSEVNEGDSKTLALADLHVSQLEEAAEALELLVDVSDKMHRKKFWLRGKVRQELEPGMLLRVTAPTQISDISSITAAFRRLDDAFSQSSNELENALCGLEALYGESITVSIRTAEEDDYEVGFVGEIPHSHEFGPMRKELLLSQVGAEPVQITTLLQVAAIPTERENESPQDAIAKISPHIANLIKNDQGNINRSGLDELTATFGKMLISTGFIAAPRWPSIGIVPLALYRAIQKKIPNIDSY